MQGTRLSNDERNEPSSEHTYFMLFESSFIACGCDGFGYSDEQSTELAGVGQPAQAL